MLVEAGETKLAYDILLSEKCPGWMYQINKGATSIWERWDSLKEDGSVNESQNNGNNMVSFNHYSFGAVGEFYYQYILGIKPLEPGYTKIKIEPYIDKRLGNVSGSYKSRAGLIKVSYEYLENGKIKFNIEVPSKSVIKLPKKEAEIVKKGKYEYIV